MSINELSEDTAYALVAGLDRAEQKILLHALLKDMKGEDRYEVLSSHNYYPEQSDD